MAGVLNDLLQVGNEELSGFSTRSRHETLLRTTRATATQIPPPASLGAALARHATGGGCWVGLARTSAYLLWTMLLCVAVLCRSRPWLAKYARWVAGLRAGGFGTWHVAHPGH